MEPEEEMRELIEALRAEVQQLRSQPASEPRFGFDWMWFTIALGVVGYFGMIIAGIIAT